MNYLHSLICSLSAFIHTKRAYCLLCRTRCAPLKTLCAACERNLPFLGQTCERCATTLKHPTDRVCGACLKQTPAVDRVIALFDYNTPINTFIIQLKFHRQLSYARLLGSLLGEELKQHYTERPRPTCIIPVPLHKERLKERGFNQATELAKWVSIALKIPINHRIATRSKSTMMQSMLTKKARKQNIKSVFFINKQHIKNIKHVALLDDVTTTGDTLNELSLALKAAGILQVDAWCLAKRILDYKG